MSVCTVLTENRRGCWMSWNWNCGRLWVTVNPGPVEEQPGLLAEPSLQLPQERIFKELQGLCSESSKWTSPNEWDWMGVGPRRLGAASSVLSGERSEWEHPLMTTVLSSPNQHSTRWWACTRCDSKHLRNTKPFPNKHWTHSFSQDACDVTYIASSTL